MNGGVRVVDICGMGGVGKTTLAKVVYDRMSPNFDASHFIFKGNNEGKSNWLLPGKNILLVLDDIDIYHLDEVMLTIDENLLGKGSRIIITTRDEGLLKGFKMHHIYRVKLLTNREAVQLLCRKVFRCDFPIRGYEEKINSILDYANGLPLAIVDFGSLLHGRRSASEWSTSALVEFKKIVNFVVMKVLDKTFLELSFDYQEIFLDIACFFIGKEIEYLEGILRCYAVEDIQLLIDKSLMTIIDKKIQMHRLLQEMGREIVQQQSPSNPEKRSRLWNFDDIDVVMQNDTATFKVEAIVLDLEDSREKRLRVEALSRMSNLRLLIFCNVKFSGVLKNLSWQLRYISWHQYPYTSLPSCYRPYFLTELNFPDSCITSVWDEHDGEKVFWHLRNMNLRGSKDLTKMPNFNGFRILERLDLEGCIKLSQLDGSIADCSKLKFLNLRNCANLVSIPNKLFSLSSLEILNLAGCFKFANCLNFAPFEEIAEGESIQQSSSPRRQKLCRSKSIELHYMTLKLLKNYVISLFNPPLTTGNAKKTFPTNIKSVPALAFCGGLRTEQIIIPRQMRN
ncbi:disease resistance protein TAO1-like [Prosopis cineraria]|uniref:disease resistance protein TAO1-like n=1 Tax=Prosopis cineraria TaxID=364024 RepID=UPI00240EB756|nr:disease resistance protein TAO1-like [Prosopis cineraria]